MSGWWTSSAASAIYGALAGGAISFATAWRTSRSATADLKLQLAHERRLSRENRLYGDVARCYETLVREAQTGLAVTRGTRPQFGASRDLPEAPTTDEFVTMLTLAYTFGSQEVQALLETWIAALTDFLFRAHVLDTLEKRSVKTAAWQQEWNDAEARLEPSRVQALVAAADLIHRIQDELQGDHEKDPNGA